MPLRRSLRSRRTPPSYATDTAGVTERDERREDGGFAAMDQIANWVRFADTKSAVLAAALGVVLTSFLTDAHRLVVIIKGGGPWACATAAVTAVAILAFGYTLTWLVRSLTPRRRTVQSGINRFAWPTLGETSAAALMQHVEEVDARIDAWRQVVDLSVVAHEKFYAFDRALRGFATFAVAFLVLVGIGIALVP